MRIPSQLRPVSLCPPSLSLSAFAHTRMKHTNQFETTINTHKSLHKHLSQCTKFQAVYDRSIETYRSLHPACSHYSRLRRKKKKKEKNGMIRHCAATTYHWQTPKSNVYEYGETQNTKTVSTATVCVWCVWCIEKHSFLREIFCNQQTGTTKT